VKILGICGSLRTASMNRLLLRAAQEQAPAGTTIDVADLHGIPVFNEDVEAKGDPDAVRRLKERIREADAVLIATPEYAWGVPGVLKNALDWVSRPTGQSFLKQKPVAVMGVSNGSGALTDERTRQQVKELVAALVAWTERVKPRA
jgi:chromate reductase